MRGYVEIKRTLLPSLIGLLLSSLGSLVMLGWYFHIPVLISVIPGYINMVFNTALCFVLSGLAIYLSQNKSDYQNKIFTIFGILILTIAGLTLSEYFLYQSLGIDQFFVKVWLFDQNPYPGRMAVNTSIAFALTGIILILFPYTHKKHIAVLIQIIIFSIILLGISALIGYLLKLEFLYSWYQYTRMAIHTSIGITLLSMALWITWTNSHNFLKFYKENEDKKIILLNTMILISITGICCLAGFTIASNPVGNQTELIIYILSASIGIGILFLYWQVTPLLNQLVITKKDAVENRNRLQAIFNHASEGIIIINAKGVIESFNPTSTKIFGYSEAEILGKNIEILIPHDLRKEHQAGMDRYLKTHDSTIVGKHSVIVPGLRKNNEPFSMEIAITEVQIDNECKFIGMMHDISERKAAEEKLVESETRFRLAFDYSPIGVALVSLDGHWLKVNQALCDIVGYSESEMLKINFQTITHPDDLETDLNYVKQLYDGEISSYHMEKRYIRKDKKITWILLTGSIIRSEQGTPLYYIAQIQDINNKKRADEELSFKAYFDALTGLVNRNQLEHSLDLTISSASRNQQRFAVFFTDLDHFKHINDSLGHDAGDELLKIIGGRLRNSIRKTDIAARFGGDEFILVLHSVNNPELAAIFAEKILDTLLKPVKIKEHELFVTASIGISFYPSDGIDYQSLIKSADLALYKAKEKGRNIYHFCTPEMNEEIHEKVMVKNQLQTAIKNHEFYLTYLPKIDVSNQIASFEALLRWKNKKYGDISPSKIIPLAEEIGIINQLDDWILRTASEQVSLLNKAQELPLKITINISTKNYLQSDFVENILHILNDIHFPPNYLELEINESLIMQDPDYSIKIISKLKEHGIKIIIDNFGTGYSSLNFLSQFKVDYIKIAREFVKNITTNFQHRELVTVMIALSKNLNIKVIAEGIEHEGQYTLLSKLGCDQFQGYYISHPLIAEKIPQFFKYYELHHVDQENK